MKVTRRRALGVAAGASGAALGGALYAAQPRRVRFDAPGEGAAPRVTGRVRVAVAGGGLAGLSAAIELAERGFEVTLAEASTTLGGKISAWGVQADGEQASVEHGFHGFFAQYYNCGDLLERAGATRWLANADGYALRHASGTTVRLRDIPGNFPLNLLGAVRQTPGLSLRDFSHDGPAARAMLAYDPGQSFARYDGVTLEQFRREGGLNDKAWGLLFSPFAKQTLSRADQISAAVGLRFFHFYFVGNPEGLAYRTPRVDLGRAVVEPLRAMFERAGGRVLMGRPAMRVVTDARGRATGLAVRGENGGTGEVRLARSSVPEAGFSAVDSPRGRVLVGSFGGALRALEGNCAHQGCPVSWDATRNEVVCPCHGGRYDAQGAVLGGPPPRALRALPVVSDASGEVRVSGVGAAEEVLPADYVVLATDVPATRALVAASNLGDARFRRAVDGLPVADPFAVMRVWLDRDALPGREPFATTAGFALIDALAIYSRLQDDARAWARRRGGSVVEVHAYAVDPALAALPERVAAGMLEDLYRALPELRGARVLHRELSVQQTFPGWPPGYEPARPTTETPAGNVMLAGDWVKLPFPAALMEAAVASGRLAANAVCRHEGVAGCVIDAVAARGPLA